MIRTSAPFLLSSAGSNRATAYVFSNKAVTLNGRTHVVWTDDVAVTRGRTFNHATNRWGSAFTIGEGRDNHNNPCLIADEAGRLQIAFGPHGMWDCVHAVCTWPPGCFRYGVSGKPGDLRSINSLKPFGYNATYAVLARTPDRRTAIVYRGGDYPLCVQFQIQRPNGGWFTAQPLFAQDIEPQYTFYGAHMTAAPDGTLYVVAHFYNAGLKSSRGVALLKSPDLGKTWLDIRNRKAATPQYLNPRVAVPHMGVEEGPYNGGVAVAPDGAVWVLVHPTLAGRYRPLLSRWGGKAWDTIDLSRHLPPERGFWRGFLSIDTAGRLHVLGCALLRDQLKVGENTFGHASSQIYYLCSTDNGRTFSCRQLSDGDPDHPSWMPTLSQPGLYHPVRNPVLLFSKGRNPPTEVYCVRVLDDQETA